MLMIFIEMNDRNADLGIGIMIGTGIVIGTGRETGTADAGTASPTVMPT